jgi:hypothetical protein
MVAVLRAVLPNFSTSRGGNMQENVTATRPGTPGTVCSGRWVSGAGRRGVPALAAAHDTAAQMIDTSFFRARQHAACITRNREQRAF